MKSVVAFAAAVSLLLWTSVAWSQEAKPQPEQRRVGIRDSFDLAWQDWLGSAAFDRPEDEWPRRWARAYVEFATHEKRDWLDGMGVRVLPR